MKADLECKSIQITTLGRLDSSGAILQPRSNFWKPRREVASGHHWRGHRVIEGETFGTSYARPKRHSKRAAYSAGQDQEFWAYHFKYGHCSSVR